MRPDDYEDVDEFLDNLETEEQASEMHHSLFSIPKYYRDNSDNYKEI